MHVTTQRYSISYTTRAGLSVTFTGLTRAEADDRACEIAHRGGASSIRPMRPRRSIQRPQEVACA